MMVPRRSGSVVGLLVALLLGLAASGCSDDSTGKGDGVKANDGPGRREASLEAQYPCVEGEKICATLLKIKICQNNKLVDFADCTNKKDAAGHQCTCSVTHMGICQYGGVACP